MGERLFFRHARDPRCRLHVGLGKEVFAAGPGYVEVAYRGCPTNALCGPNGSGLGNAVGIRHDNGQYSWYGHLSEVLVDEKMLDGSRWRVERGDLIGRTGSSGQTATALLHYEERTSLWEGPISPGPMLAYHGTKRVSYPSVLKAATWSRVLCGKQANESACKGSHLVRNDGYTAQEAAQQPATPGQCRPRKLGVVFVLDDSGSNASTDPRLLRADAADIALEYLLDFLPPGTAVSAIKFENRATTLVDPVLLSSKNRDAIADRIRSSLRTSGGTNYESAFQLALQHLQRLQSTQRVVIFLSDGQPTSSYSSDQRIGAQSVPIYTVGYGPVRNLPVLIDIAKRSRGSYRPIENVSQAANAFSEIVNLYLCNRSITDAVTTLRPNRTWNRSFTVKKGVPGITSLVTWTTQATPALALIRPDGSRLTIGGGRRKGESARRTGQQAARFDVSRPAPGTWTLQARSPAWVNIAFDVWRTPARR